MNGHQVLVSLATERLGVLPAGILKNAQNGIEITSDRGVFLADTLSCASHRIEDPEHHATRAIDTATTGASIKPDCALGPWRGPVQGLAATHRKRRRADLLGSQACVLSLVTTCYAVPLAASEGDCADHSEGHAG